MSDARVSRGGKSQSKRECKSEEKREETRVLSAGYIILRQDCTMSWLFGYRNAQPQDFSQFVQAPALGNAAGDGDVPRTPTTKSQMDAYRFDSSALERAAAAAKDLERSRTIQNSH